MENEWEGPKDVSSEGKNSCLLPLLSVLRGGGQEKACSRNRAASKKPALRKVLRGTRKPFPLSREWHWSACSVRKTQSRNLNARPWEADAGQPPERTLNGLL